MKKNEKKEIKEIKEVSGDFSPEDNTTYTNLTNVGGNLFASNLQGFNAPNLTYVGKCLWAGGTQGFNAQNLTHVGGSLCAIRSQGFNAPNLTHVEWDLWEKESQGFNAPKIPFGDFVVEKCDKFREVRIQAHRPEVVHLGCFRGTLEEAEEAINKKYNGEMAENYIKKVRSCFALVK